MAIEIVDLPMKNGDVPLYCWLDPIKSFHKKSPSIYPPVNVYVTMENHCVSWENQLF
jgi:hypothetical protein